ncbi:leucine--tRNA ligase, mitochondrial isoform X2 [Toxorhynchites rutilus septentrionalis]|uniref:leucine--tRNA ligase, mitochondrial isoform X2 n=1 Tax=Toxorhynchites rutilus septentrionalis TaxID=329112 RepID=UPI00247A1633|nr:leucine--tRNA ligase, mitochondrial isoform X2 [Toxorhynchites rutilus septentrionalis]
MNRMNALQRKLLINSRKMYYARRLYCSTVSSLQSRDLTSEMKLKIEQKWRGNLGDNRFDPTSSKPKRYVLAMFPYPSGSLHMGHVRVYTISDAMARFYRLSGYNVLHPMGWDAFGLPAENAAMQRKIPADQWTAKNITQMREQLEALQFSFDWEREFATCDPEYYRWTQKLFLMLYNDGLVYQKDAVVNWDPIDKTVLADEQVDDNGCSWRSGAKVEKKFLRQWFVKTTKLAESLLNGLSDPTLEDWRDIINLQRHWIGECDGYNFELKIIGSNNTITVWTERPENLKEAIFIAISPSNSLNSASIEDGKLSIMVENPITGQPLPVIVTEKVQFPDGNDSYMGVASEEGDRQLTSLYQCSNAYAPITNSDATREDILKLAAKINLGGHKVNSKLRDWLISRQRFWGTPIPIIHCPNCGTVPVPESHLPVELPLDTVGQSLARNKKWFQTICPECHSSEAKRETDTMDTFVDSSWYYLRFIDPNNRQDLFDSKLSHRLMPVDLYVGGKEHAVLHMYYARFMNHYLHSKGLVSTPEPFKRLLVQGMVMGRSFRLKDSGKYLPASDVAIIDDKKNKMVEKTTGAPVIALWEKMSKSKLNGVDPMLVLNQHGCDTLRLIMLGDVAPTSHRNWSEATFPGILNWQKRLWMTMYDYRLHRLAIRPDQSPPDRDDFRQQDSKLWDSRNFFAVGATFNYKFSHQLSVGISKMQGLTNAIRRASPEVVAFSPQYERSVAAQIIMLAPIAPHFASELWEQFVTLPHRLNPNSDEIQWDRGLFEQNWPVIDDDYALDLTVKVNDFECCILKVPTRDLNQLTHQDSLDLALQQGPVVDYIGIRKVCSADFVLNPSCHATLSITLHPLSKEDKEQLQIKTEKISKKDKKKKKKQKIVIRQ